MEAMLALFSSEQTNQIEGFFRKLRGWKLRALGQLVPVEQDSYPVIGE
jgi:hypothetical protein